MVAVVYFEVFEVSPSLKVKFRVHVPTSSPWGLRSVMSTVFEVAAASRLSISRAKVSVPRL